MAKTVKQVATMSKVSTLHSYDESGLLKPAYRNDNGYRSYEEPQLLVLQQILFYRFGVFEADPRSGELKKSGSRIKLQEQPFKVLLALLEHPGEVVSRHELR